MHHFEYKKLRETWHQEIMKVAWPNAGRPSIPEPCEITYRRSYWNNPMDWDNMAASFKLIGDALDPPKDHLDGLLTEDNPKYLKNLELQQVRLHKDEHPKTQIIIRSL